MTDRGRAAIRAELFPDGRRKSNSLCNLCYGAPARLHPPNPRPDFEEACRIV